MHFKQQKWANKFDTVGTVRKRKSKTLMSLYGKALIKHLQKRYVFNAIHISFAKKPYKFTDARG